jgi:hypothetical protein
MPPLKEIAYVIAALLLAGVALWGLDQFPSINATIKQIIRVLVIVLVAIWVILKVVSWIP